MDELTDERVLAYKAKDAKALHVNQRQKNTNDEYLRIKRRLVQHTQRSTRNFRYTIYGNVDVDWCEIVQMLKNDGFKAEHKLNFKGRIPCLRNMRTLLGCPTWKVQHTITVECNWHVHGDC